MKKIIILAPLLVSVLSLSACFESKIKHREVKVNKNSVSQSNPDQPKIIDLDKKNEDKSPAQIESEEKKAKATEGRNNNAVWGDQFKGMDKARNTENVVKDANNELKKKIEDESK